MEHLIEFSRSAAGKEDQAISREESHQRDEGTSKDPL
jgi:hypothetical protein